MLNVTKTDITPLQVDAIVNAKLTKDQRLPALYVIYAAGPSGVAVNKIMLAVIPPATVAPSPFRSISTGIDGLPPWSGIRRAPWKPCERR